MLSAQDALAALLADCKPASTFEQVPSMQAFGRVLAEDVKSSINVPPAANSQMDGYAVDAQARSGDRLRVSQRIAAGHLGSSLEPGTAARIFTGALLPGGAAAIVMQEECEPDGEFVTLKRTPKPAEWIRPEGMDIQAGAVILRAGTRLRAQDVGLAASVGVAQLRVSVRLKVALLFTGDELAMPGQALPPGAIYNSNRFVLRGLLEGLGCEVLDFGGVPDDRQATIDALQRAAAAADVVISSGGVSVGEEDHVKPAVEANGRLQLWQLAIKPGKPLAYGHVRKPGGEVVFFGLPGNPVSSLVTFLLFTRPYLLRMQGVAQVEPFALSLPSCFEWPRADKRQEYLRARLNAQGLVELFANQNSAVLSSAVWADGLVVNPPNQTIAVGDLVRFIPFASLV